MGNSCSDLEKLPSSILGASKLKKLTCNRCDVLQLPDAMQMKPASYNFGAISAISAARTPLPNLEELTITSCFNVSELPEWVEELACLTDLTLNETPITRLPTNLGASVMYGSQLANVSLQKCSSLQADALPRGLLDLDKLALIDLTDCDDAGPLLGSVNAEAKA